MGAPTQVADKQSAGSTMGVFERYLTVWVFLCIVAGIALGQFLPALFQAIARLELARVKDGVQNSRRARRCFCGLSRKA